MSKGTHGVPGSAIVILAPALNVVPADDVVVDRIEDAEPAPLPAE
jgi:Na+/H+-dicarboxylate symporter